MLFIMRATIANGAGNKMVKGNMEATINKIMEDVRPKEAYFTVDKGQRTIYFIVDVEKASDMPKMLEPLWLALEADVDIIPAMSASDFAAAAPGIANAVSRY
jgi:hypothetical protein